MHRSLFGTSGATIKIMEMPEFNGILGKFCVAPNSFVLQSNKIKIQTSIHGVPLSTIQAAHPYVESMMMKIKNQFIHRAERCMMISH